MRLYALDHHYGASGEVYALTVRSLRHLVRATESGSYLSVVGDQLRSISGEVMEFAGCLAFDAGRQREARSWWLEALHTARLAGDTHVEVTVLGSMSWAANHHGRGREAVELASGAAQLARRQQSTPRLLSLLTARQALGHAHTGEAGAAREALDRAHEYLDRGRREHDPDWLDFWDQAHLANCVGRVNLAVGDLPAAERGSRDALATIDSVRYPRNRALYQADLASVLIAQDDLDEAVPVIAGAAVQAADVNSVRLTAKIQTVVDHLHTHHGDTPAVRELTEWTTTNLSNSIWIAGKSYAVNRPNVTISSQQPTQAYWL